MSANNNEKLPEEKMQDAIKAGVNKVGKFLGNMGNTVKEWWNSDTYDANEGSGSSGTSTPTTDSPVMTYGEYEGLINTAKAQRENTYKTWDDYAKNEIARANAVRAYSYDEAERDRKLATVDAHNAYELNKTNYGVNAELAARQGLIGGGYGEYMDAKAYATSRGEIAAATANAAKARRDADMTYADAEADINEKVIEGKAAADTTYNEFENGIQAQIIADKKAEEANAKTEEANKNTAYLQISELIANGTFTTPDQVKAAAAQAGLDDVTIKSLLSGMLGDFSTFKTSIENGMLDMSALNAAKGLSISEDEYNELLGLYRNAFDTSEDSFKDEDGTFVSRAEAEAILKRASEDSALDGNIKEKLQSTFDSIYESFKSKGFKIDYLPAKGAAPAKGDDVRIKDEDGTMYKVEIDGWVNATGLLNAFAVTVPDGEAFGYDGSIYIKKDGEIYKLRVRNDKRKDDFYNLKNALLSPSN